MVRAWLINEADLNEDRLENNAANRKYLDAETIRAKLGVFTKEYGKNLEVANKLVDDLKLERGYGFEDQLDILPDSPTLGEMIKKFATEHLHDEEETRLVLDGSTYFDVRDENDSWVRVELTKGDLIIVPAGIYHRLTLDEHKFLILRRLFIARPKWVSINRPDGDSTPIRQEYLQTVLKVA